MAVLKNRAKMSTSTTGTGTITLGSAESGYQTFADAGVANADVVRYVIEDTGGAFEIGTGTYTATGTTLTRTVSESSNSDAAINLSGSATVFIGATAEDIPALYAENYDGTSPKPSATGTNAIAIGDSAISSGEDAFAGPFSRAAGDDSVALGIANNSSVYGAGGLQSISIGQQSRAMALQSVALGSGAYVDSDSARGIALGQSAYVQQCDFGTAIGAAARVHGGNSASEATAFGSSYASGTSSFAAAMSANTSSYGAQGANSIAMGYQAKATGNSSVCLSQQSTASGSSSCVIGGYGNVADATYSFASGQYADTKSIFGKMARANGRFSATGDAQSGTFVLRSDTTDATAEPMTTANTPTSSLNITQIVVPSNAAFAFHGTIVAKQSGSANAAAWKVEGLIVNNGGTTTLTNSATTVISNTPSWGMALSADDTNDALAITVTGAASTDIRWVATIHTSEVTYA
jgi:hypothetical protein